MTSEVLIGYSEGSAVPILATHSKVESNSVIDKVNIQSQYFRFIFRAADLVSKSIEIKRGLRVYKDSAVYEISPQGKDLWFYNDPLHLDVVIHTVLVRDKHAISPSG